MPVTGGRSECDPVAMTAERKVTSSPPSTAIVFGPVNSPRPFTMVIPFALTTPVMPFTSPSTMPCLFCWAWPKSSSGSLHAHADLGEDLARLLQRMRRLHPRLRGDTADRDAGAADAGLLDQDDVRAQLGRPDGGRVAARPTAQDGDVTLHRLAPSLAFGPAS